MSDFSDNYYSWLDRQMSSRKICLDSFSGPIKDFLINRLESNDVQTQDSMPKIREDIFGKRKVGRPRKEPEDSVFTRDGFASGILRDETKEKARKLDRLNPQPTEKLKHLQEIAVGLREIGFDVEDSLKSRDEIEAMIADIDSLRKEAGLKKIDESYEPYGRFRTATIEYIEKKKDFKRYFEAAKESLDKQEERRADELLASLKDEPRELKDSYQKVIDTYSDLCYALTAIIDVESGDVDVSQNIGVGEIEKSGFGLIKGENLKAYSHRMKSLGRGRDVPNTIRDIDEKIENTERQWRSVAGISIDEFEKVKENWKRSVQNLMSKCSLASNMKIAAVNYLLGGLGDTDKTKSEKETFTSNGIIADSGEKKSNAIKYGCLHSINPTKHDNDIGDSFGGIVVRWKPHCVVATLTFGDSLDIESSDTTFETPCLVTDASPCCFNPLKQDAVNALKDGVLDIGLESARTIFGIPYIELQFHGEGWYKPQSVDSISFWCDDDIRNLSQSAMEQIIKNRITIYVKDDNVKIADYIED